MKTVHQQRLAVAIGIAAIGFHAFSQGAFRTLRLVQEFLDH